MKLVNFSVRTLELFFNTPDFSRITFVAQKLKFSFKFVLINILKNTCERLLTLYKKSFPLSISLIYGNKFAKKLRICSHLLRKLDFLCIVLTFVNCNPLVNYGCDWLNFWYHFKLVFTILSVQCYAAFMLITSNVNWNGKSCICSLPS